MCLMLMVGPSDGYKPIPFTPPHTTEVSRSQVLPLFLQKQGSKAEAIWSTRRNQHPHQPRLSWVLTLTVSDWGQGCQEVTGQKVCVWGKGRGRRTSSFVPYPGIYDFYKINTTGQGRARKISDGNTISCRVAGDYGSEEQNQAGNVLPQ